MYKDLNIIINKLSKSTFRSNFKLKQNDKKYIEEKGIETIRKHAHDFVESRIAKEVILNDGRQTPMRGHPVFIAQHATATCCRSCLYKWHKIPKNKELSSAEKDYIINLIMLWINNQMNSLK